LELRRPRTRALSLRSSAGTCRGSRRAPFTFSGTYRDGNQQRFTVLYSAKQSDGGLQFVI